jgi:DNA-binding transcriptional MerR regulator
MKNPLTVYPASIILKCSPQTVRDLERQGLLRATRTSTGIRLFRPEDVERLAAEREERKSAAHTS